MTSLSDRAVRRAYLSARGVALPDDIPVAVLRETGIRRATELIRGELHRRGYANSGSMHFRGRRVTVRARGMFEVGSSVVLADDVLIDAFSRKGVRLDDQVTVARGAAILGSGVIREPGEGVTIGQHSAVGAGNVIWGQGGVEIGADCLLGPYVTIVSENHRTDVGSLIREQPGERGPIVIEDDCWLGNNVTVVAGVTIGRGSVVGAGSVVTRSVPANSIVVGVPGRVVKERT